MAIKIKQSVVKAEVTASTPKAQKVIQQLQEKAASTLEGELKVKLAPAKVKAKTDAEVKAEEFISLHQHLVEIGAFTLMKHYEDLKKQLQLIANESGAPKDTQFVFAVENGRVVFKECRIETTITNKDYLIKVLGQPTFNEIAKVTLTDARKYLSAAELEKCTTQDYGARTLLSVIPGP